MTRFLPLLAAVLFAGSAVAQDTPADPASGETMEAAADTVVVTFDPEQSRALATLGDSLFKASDYEGAMESYTEGFELDSTYAKNPFGQARTYAATRKYQEAMDAYRIAIELSEGVEGMGNIFTAARDERRAIEENLAVQQSAQAVADKITRATTLLQAEPVSENSATTALELLEDVRVNADYDSSQVAFYYAKALNVLGRSDEATHYAQIAVDQSEGQADRSAFFIQLGLAHMGADNEEGAREAFTAAKEGAWAGWADHYLGQLDAEDEAGG